MFKIPSYADLEKNDKEIEKNTDNVKFNLFNKRKELDKKSEEDEEDELLSNIDLDSISIKKVKLTNESEEKDQPKSAQVDQPKPTTVQAPATVPKPIVQTKSDSTPAAFNSNTLLVNSKQRGNPILKYIKNVQWRYSDGLTPDYCMGRNICAFYLSMKYHLLNTEYIHDRIRELGRAYEVRVLLTLVDIKETKHCLKELEKICILANYTLILCWSYEEAGRYLETYKMFEYKSADQIMDKVVTNNLKSSEENFASQYTDFLCEVKSINKTDASTLRQTFGSIKQLSEASKNELSVCPGLGPLKVNRLYDIFHTPFLLNNKT